MFLSGRRAKEQLQGNVNFNRRARWKLTCQFTATGRDLWAFREHPPCGDLIYATLFSCLLRPTLTWGWQEADWRGGGHSGASSCYPLNSCGLLSSPSGSPIPSFFLSDAFPCILSFPGWGSCGSQSGIGDDPFRTGQRMRETGKGHKNPGGEWGGVRRRGRLLVRHHAPDVGLETSVLALLLPQAWGGRRQAVPKPCHLGS